MTQKEAIIKVLEFFGGRAKLADIYPRVTELAVFQEDSDKEATIRATMQRHPEHFRKSEGKKGWWELVSFQEEIADLKAEIVDLKAQLAAKDATIKELKSIKTADDLAENIVEQALSLFKYNKTNLDVVRQILLKTERPAEEAKLDAFIEGKEPHNVTNIRVTNIRDNYAPTIEQNGGTIILPERGREDSKLFQTQQ